MIVDSLCWCRLELGFNTLYNNKSYIGPAGDPEGRLLPFRSLSSIVTGCKTAVALKRSVEQVPDISPSDLDYTNDRVKEALKGASGLYMDAVNAQ